MSKSENKFLVLVTLVLAIGAFATFVLMHRHPVVEINTEGYPFLGNKDASVQVVAIESLECPHCKHFVEESFADLNKNYIVPGKIKYTLILVPLKGPRVLSGQSAYCILSQNGPDAYFRFIELAFANQPPLEKAWTLSGLLDLAKQVPGVDTTALHRCLDNGETQQAYWKRADEAWAVASKGVPTVFVNGKDTPAEELLKAIDAELAKK